MTRNEARGILIRMQSEIENPYSTEAQALGIAIEKMERDYETEYWECQWKIDQYERSLAAVSVARKELENLYTELYAEYCDLIDKKRERPSKKERAADALIRHCKSRTGCDHCPFSNAPFCQIAAVTKEGAPRRWDKGACKVENRPTDERNDDERTSYRLDKLEAEMGDFAEKLWGLKKALIRHIIDTEGVEIETNPLDRDLR